MFSSYIYSQCQPPPQVSVTPNVDKITCTKQSITLVASGGVSFSWDGVPIAPPAPTNTSMVTVSYAGLYSVTVTDANGCTNRANAVITIDTTYPTAQIMTESTLLTCARTSTTLYGSGSTGHQWSTNETTPSITVSSVGNVYLTVTDPNNGCSNITSIPITENKIIPTISVTATPSTVITCQNPVIVLSAMQTNAVSTPTYLWSNEQSSASIVVTRPATYYVTVKDAINGCTTEGKLNIEEIQNGPIPVINVIDSVLTCKNTSLELEATGGASYRWSTGATSQKTTISEKGKYTVTITSPINDCTAATSINIREDIVEPVFNITKSDSLFTCKTTNITLSVNIDNHLYLWQNGFRTQNIKITKPNTYSVTVTNKNNGCSADRSIIISEIDDVNANFDIIPPTCVFANNGSLIVTKTGGYPPYNVSLNGYSYGINDTISGLYDGRYDAIVTDSIGCSALFRKIDIVADNYDCINIPNALTPNGDECNDTWLLDGIENFPDAKVTIFNRWGQNIYECNGNYVPWDGKYKNKFVPIGTYLYTIQINNKLKYSGSLTVIF
jgi:gliding motility-associated-like protein